MTDRMEHPPATHAPGDIPPEQFAAAGHEIVDWLADYLGGGAERHPVLARVKPGEVRASLPESPPLEGEPLARLVEDFETKILPGITHWNHPGFMAYFAITGSAPGILGEMLAAGLNANAMLWRTSPAATELEQLTLDWLRQMIGLEPGWFGLINDTASISSMLALAAARESAELGIREHGMAGRHLPALRVYCSEQAHSSIDKGAITLGIGQENVVHIGVDARFRMRPEMLEDAIAADRAAGHLPIACVATVGTTSTTSVDPVRAIAEICRRENVWLHVDGAYGGVAAILPEMRWVLDGIELADSLVVNPHKWLFTPVDCSAFWTRQPDVLRRAFTLVPEYLRTAEPDEVVNLMDYGVQLGRRFRALKLWFVIRAFGVEGLAERLRAHIALARELEQWIAAEPGWELMAPVPFSTVCFRYAPDDVPEGALDAWNAAIMERVNASGAVLLSHTKLHGKYVLRIAIGNLRTERRHVEEAWRLLREAALGA